MITTQEIQNFITKDRASARKRNSRVGEDYYEGKHDILQCRIFYFNADGKLVEDKQRSNAKIPHPFFTELVDQATQYLLSGDDPIITSNDQELAKHLGEYFDEEFETELSDTVTDCQTKGFAYLYAYKDKNDRISFQNADSMGVVEASAKDTSDNKDYIIYYYQETRMTDDKKVLRIRIFDEENIYFFVSIDNEKIEPDPDEKINPCPNVIYKKDGEDGIYYENLGFLPFFRLDNNKKQASSLVPVKLIIDDYDIMSCGLTNNLKDFDNPIHIVKGFEGDNLDILQTNLKTKRIIGVGEGGDLEIKTVDIPYQARKEKLEIDEKNIYRFGMGFNAAQVGDGNITNVVILARYSLLDLKCNKIEKQIRKFLKKIIQIVLDEINRKNQTDYTRNDVEINFSRKMITNARDNAEIKKIEAETKQVQINYLLGLFNTLDNDTIIRKICDILDIDYEEIKSLLPEKEDYSNSAAMEILQRMNEES